MREILAWIKQYIAAHHVPATVYQDQAHIRGDWYYVPVHVRKGDAYEQAVKMQEIEDSWNNQQPWRHPRLMIVPSGPRRRSRSGTPAASPKTRTTKTTRTRKASTNTGA